MQPTYLRVVINARCSLACTYCHAEGDLAGDAPSGLGADVLMELLFL